MKNLDHIALQAAEQAQSSDAGWQCFNDGFKAGAEEMRDGLLQLCKDFSDRQNRPYMGDVLAQVESLFDLIVSEIPKSLERKAEQAQPEPRCACGDSFTSDAVCANCLAAKQQAEPVAWQYRARLANGSVYGDWHGCSKQVHDRYKSGEFNGDLEFEARELYAKPPAVAVPDGYVLTKIPHEYAKTLVNGGWNQYADGWNACRAAMLAAAQKGGAQ